MRQILMIAFPIFLIGIIASCRNKNVGTLNYQTLAYDTDKIAIFQWDTSKYEFPKNSDPLPLEQTDLMIIDSFIKDAIDSFNRTRSIGLYEDFNRKISIDSFTIKKEKYKCQYIPFKDVNGQRIVLVIGFSAEFPPWKTILYAGPLHYGIRRFELKLNLSDKTWTDLQTGSYG
jgi:hypothetical protein